MIILYSFFCVLLQTKDGVYWDFLIEGNEIYDKCRSVFFSYSTVLVSFCFKSVFINKYVTKPFSAVYCVVQ